MDASGQRLRLRRGAVHDDAAETIDLDAHDLDNVQGDAVYMREHAHAARVYWSCTGVLVITIFAVSQAVGIFAYPQLEAPALLEAADIPGHGLKTHFSWYPKDTRGVTEWLTDMQFLRYATVLLWLTVVTTGLGLELVCTNACI